MQADHVMLRDYSPADAEAMYALDVTCFEPVFRFSRRAMRGFAEAENAVTLLAAVGSELVGFCIAQIERQIGYVVTLDVAPAWRRRGLAQSLMAELESRVRATGASGMALHVYAGNESAMRFYEKIGYDRVGMAEKFYGLGMDALVYRKKL